MLLVDADLYLYRATAATEQEICWDEDDGSNIWSLDTDLKLAKEMFFDQMETFKEPLHAHRVILCLTSKNNFRRDVDPRYKNNRVKIRKPLGYLAMVDWAKHHFSTVSLDGLEADDVMGILATKPENKDKAIIVSDDKDMKTIPTRLYRPISGESLDISQQEADKNFLTQALTGDSTDGYKGLSGVGIKKAEVILGARPHWGAVEAAYIKAGYTKEEALTQARLARILRSGDWDYDKKEVKLWTP